MLDYLLLAGLGFIAWIVSTIGGGGGALLLVPLVGFIAGSQAVAPVTTLATLIGGSGRAFVFWKDIHWPVAKWGLPGALVGGLLGAVLFTAAPAEWLQIVVGLYLVSTVLQYRLGRKERTFKVADWWFLPAEFVAALLDGLIGAVGPVMNTLYLNAGVTKERMAGTKTAISLPTHFVKIGTYTTLGAMGGDLWLFGLAAGAGALASNWLAKRLLKNMPEMRFRAIVVSFMALSGALMIWQQRETMAALFD
jgi:uncharacterized membrane protein YfcA